jgi:hypothetical protein
MVEIQCVMPPPSPTGRGVFLSQASCDDPLKGDEAADGRADSRTKLASDVSLSGLVDAILEVGTQRKLLLDQVRSALVSGDDAEALRFARQLCGLPA